MEAAGDGRLELLLSPELYVELEDVLGRPKLSERLATRRTTPANLMSGVGAIAEMVLPKPLPHPGELRDRDDLHVLECAAAAGADAIITGDEDLLVMGSFQGVPIINVRTALRLVGIPAQ